MEIMILNTLEYEITVPTAEFFIQRFVKIARGNTVMLKLTSYFAERTMQEYSFIKYRPSSIAAAALYLAIKTLNCQTDPIARNYQDAFSYNDYCEKVPHLMSHATYDATKCRLSLIKHFLGHLSHTALLLLRVTAPSVPRRSTSKEEAYATTFGPSS
jgi:hypothetical protein